jgi:hypothetical protein
MRQVMFRHAPSSAPHGDSKMWPSRAMRRTSEGRILPLFRRTFASMFARSAAESA